MIKIIKKMTHKKLKSVRLFKDPKNRLGHF